MPIAVARLLAILAVFHGTALAFSADIIYYSGSDCNGNRVGCTGINSSTPTFCCGAGVGPDGHRAGSSALEIRPATQFTHAQVNWYQSGGCKDNQVGTDNQGECHNWNSNTFAGAGKYLKSGNFARDSDNEICPQIKPNMIFLAGEDGGETKIPIPEGKSDIYMTLFFGGHTDMLLSLAKTVTTL